MKSSKVQKQQKLDFSSSKKFAAKNAGKNIASAIASKANADDALHVTHSPKRRLGIKADEVLLKSTDQVTLAKEIIVEEKPEWIKELLSAKNNLIDMLKGFDLDQTFGNNVGLTRLQRWNRAKKLGLNPPEDIGEILKTKEAMEDQELRESLWFGRL
ncbi:hypothetical protein HDU67_001798 [Dinochytrium kinnereticum]|nr:hypothetical protein HDU67_001798 [Dinochytrium kinnereticum]